MTTSTALREPPAHPLAGRVMSGAEMIVQVLADEGIDTIFGYSGGAILPTYDAVFRYNQENADDGVEPMPLIVPANEQGAGFMAAGYARASGKVGCVLVTSGPGATNCVTRCATAWPTRCPSWSSAARCPPPPSAPTRSRRPRSPR